MKYSVSQQEAETPFVSVGTVHRRRVRSTRIIKLQEKTLRHSLASPRFEEEPLWLQNVHNEKQKITTERRVSTSA